MATQDPKTKIKQDKNGLADQGKTNDQHPSDKHEKKKMAFDPGVTNNANTQAGTAQSGYDEKNPKKPGGKQQEHPKVTNQENDITNSEQQDKWSEEPVDEQSGNSTPRTDPEIDSPIPDAERTEKKIPKD